MSQLVATNLTKSFPTRSGPLPVLRGVSLDLDGGENLAIVGPSGCGKSTLLHILGTLDRPTSGELRFDGDDPFALDEPALAAFRNRRVGFVFQDHHLLPQCSVLENVLVPTIAAGRAPAGSVERATALLARVGLGERLDHRPAELSGGERQRAALARALVNRPAVLLADEPTGNLDRTTAAEVGQVLLDMQRLEHTTLIVVTHSAELAALLSRRVTLNEGRLEPAD